MAFRSRVSGVPLLLLASLARALQVTPGSQCAPMCLDQKGGNALDPDASTTGVSNIVCDDSDYTTSAVGAKFKSCVECLQTSAAVDGAETDVGWFLYNLRYAVDVCVYSFPNSTAAVSSSPCALDQTCGALKNALEVGNLEPGNESEYQYCSAGSGIFASQGSNCAQCLQVSAGQKYLSNFVVALSAGCQQHPAPGQLLSLSGSVFSSTPITALAPPANGTAGSTQPTPILTTGAIVGIVVGASLLFLGAIALFVVHCRRQRRFAEKDSRLLPPAAKTPTSYITITSHHLPCYTMDYKRDSAEGESRDPPDYKSNADYYDRMADIMGERHPSDISVASAPKDLSALPTHPAYLPRSVARASRATSPNLELRPPSRANKPDSYALQQYLRAAEDSLSMAIPPPPPNPPSSRSTPGSNLGSPPTSSSRTPMASPPAPSVRSHAKSPPVGPANLPARPSPAVGSVKSQARSPPAASITPNFTPSAPPSGVSAVTVPPPPPRASKAPSLILPSVSRAKAPRKYSPPKIQIQDATPVDGPSGMDISLPISYPEERFRDTRGPQTQHEPRVSPGLSTGGMNEDHVVEQMVNLPKQYQELPIVSGKSILYG